MYKKILSCIVVLGLVMMGSALAQTASSDNTPAVSPSLMPASTSVAMPNFHPAAKPGPAAGGADARDPAMHWEVELHFGGVVGSSFGGTSTSCTATLSPSCDPTASFGDRGGISELPTAFTPDVPVFMMQQGVRPKNGPLFGARLGYDLTERLQLEFTFNYVRSDLAWQNLAPVQEDVRRFCDPNSFNSCFSFTGTGVGRTAFFQGDGRPQGNQQQYLVNLNYHFNTDKRFVPYVGVGLGMVRWYNGPKVNIFVRKDYSCGSVPGCRFIITKSAGGANSFAADMVAGFKYFATPHVGFRAEISDVVSFNPDFSHGFAVVDVDNSCNPAFFNTTPCAGITPVGVGGNLPPTGVTRQNNVFNQFGFSGGIFYRF